MSRASLDRWIRAWRAGGFDALVPSGRHAEPSTPAQVLELAAALKREVPGRTAAQVAAILAEHTGGVVPSPRTLQRHFAAGTEHSSRRAPAAGVRPVRGRHPERTLDRGRVTRAGHRRTQDVPDGVHRRPLPGVDRLPVGPQRRHPPPRAALRAGLAARGIPHVVYLDNGAAMVSKQLLRALAVLGIRLTHSRPGRPAGRGKIERFFRTVRDQFLIELAVPGATSTIADLATLNELFAAWVETVYHQVLCSRTSVTVLPQDIGDSSTGVGGDTSRVGGVDIGVWVAHRGG